MAPKALGSSSLASLSPTPNLYHLVSLPQHPLLRAHPQCHLSLSLFGCLRLLRVFVCSVTSGVSNSVTPMDCSPPGSSVCGILQARILEWVAMPSSRDLPDPGIKPMFLICWHSGSLPLVPPYLIF